MLPRPLVSFTVSTLFPFILSAQPSGDLRPILDTAIAKMEQHSLHRHEIDWRKFRVQAYEATAGISNPDSFYSRFPLLFEWLRDDHGGLQHGSRYISWGKQEERGNPRYRYFDSIATKLPALKAARWNEFAYFRVPGGTTRSVPKVIQLITDSLCTIDPSTVKGLILDLRLNRGGNVWFNLATLASLIGEGNAGGIRYLDERAPQMTRIEKGKVFGNGQWYGADSAACQLFPPAIPVVLLTSPITASSAEALLLAFKGRANTLVIGEPTGGYTTSNNSFTLADNLTLVLATGYMMDRSGKVYTGAVEPDRLIVEGDNFSELKKDKKVMEAVKWLEEKRQ
jgi:carboxyl-terminal processing protease